MIASLERSSSSEDDNDNDEQERGGRRHRIRPDETRHLILRLKTNDIPRPIRIRPTRLGALFPRGGQSMIYSRFLLLAPVLVVVLVPIQGEGRTHGWKEKKRSNCPTKLVSCFTHPCLHIYIPALTRALHWYYLRGLRSLLLCHHSHQQARIRHSLPQARALHLLKLQLTQQDCTNLDSAMRLYLRLPNWIFRFRTAISIPLVVGDSSQQHARPLPLPPHNRQLLVDPPLSSLV